MKIHLKVKLSFLLIFVTILIQAQSRTFSVSLKAPLSTPDNAIIHLLRYDGARPDGYGSAFPFRWILMSKDVDGLYHADITFPNIALNASFGLRAVLNKDSTNMAMFFDATGNLTSDAWNIFTGQTSLLIDKFTSWKKDIIPWKKQATTIATKWADLVTPDNAWREYPRPQFSRSEWLNLNGIWGYKEGSVGDKYSSDNFYQEILVPFPVESALSGIKAQRKQNVWYKKTFTVPKNWVGKRVKINFDAVDWESEVFVNGVSVGIHRGGYDPFSYDITDKLKTSGLQEVVVRVFDPSDIGGQPNGKQWNNPFSVFYTACTGIWQTVWLEPVENIHIENLNIVPDIDRSKLKLTVNVPNSTSTSSVNVIVKSGENIITTQNILPNIETEIVIPNQILWTPNSPFLYDLEIKLMNNSLLVDSVGSYFGMRKISMGTWGGYKRIMLNNEYCFNFGVLDQGYWPEGIYTAPCDSALIFDIQKIKSLGFNTARKHGKTENQRWYYHCDRLGLLVWQDIPSAPTNRDGANPPIAGDEWSNNDSSRVSAKNKANFKLELEHIVNSFKNHPSIVDWIVFNENWGQFSTLENTQKVITLDPNRLVTSASGFTDFEIGDFQDYHSYPYPVIGTSYPGAPAQPTTTRIRAVGEYGGVEYNVPNHTWYLSPSSVYDKPESSVEGLTMRFTSLAERANILAKQQGLSAAIYTQIFDVENETNGIVTYDRKVDKLLVDRVKPLVEYTIKSCNTVDDFARIFGPNDTWKYNVSQPVGDWTNLNFSDISWNSGLSCFGTGGGTLFSSLLRTNWSTSDIWMRKTFNPGNITEDQIKNIFAELYIDGAVTIYINGVEALAFKEESYPIQAKHFYTLSDDARKTILANQNNVIAVHCNNSVGGSFIGVGLSVNKNISTGLDENSIENSLNAPFEIIPNPVRNLINIKLNSTLRQKEKIEVFSIIGRSMGSRIIEEGTSNATLSIRDFDLTPGIYLLKLMGRSERLIVMNL